MYSVKAHVLELTALLCAHGIEDVVVCAGSRSAPLAHTFASCPRLRCTAMVDERSAAFTALGMCAALKRPCAVCCTSGSALLDMAPAVAEAYYQRLPLLVISADRPEAWIGQMDGQTMVQPGALQNVVRRQVSLPEPKDAESLWYGNRLVNEALLELCHAGSGPVHINVPLAEPLYDFGVEALPEVRVIRREQSRKFGLSSAMRAEWQSARRPLIVVGQELAGLGLEAPLKALMAEGCMVFAEHLANLVAIEGEPGFAGLFDLVLAGPAESLPEELRPDFVATVGGHIVSKRLKQYLRVHPPAVHWHVSPDGACPDLFQCLTRAVEAEDLELLEGLAVEPCHADPAFAKAWNARQERVATMARDFDPEPFADATVMQCFLASMPEGAALALGNSSPVRNAQYFPLPKDTEVTCNRGINGIDGSLSAACGYAQASGRPTFCCIGDLSFFYDQNALWRRDIPANLRILLFNNGGGGIFHLIPGPDKSEHRDAFIAGASALGAEHLAKTLGMAYWRAGSFEELRAALLPFCTARPASGPMLLEVATSLEASAQASRRMIAEAAASLAR